MNSSQEARSLPVRLLITFEAPRRIFRIDPIFGTFWIVSDVFEINDVTKGLEVRQDSVDSRLPLLCLSVPHEILNAAIFMNVMLRMKVSRKGSIEGLTSFLR